MTKWYAVVNDVVGGWAVATVDMPCSQISLEREKAGEAREIADFISEKDAREIARLHNEDEERRATHVVERGDRLTQAIEVAARAISDHQAFRLDMPDGDPNGPMEEDYEVAQAVIVALSTRFPAVRDWVG